MSDEPTSSSSPVGPGEEATPAPSEPVAAATRNRIALAPATPGGPASRPAGGPRPGMLVERRPLYKECGGYTFRLDPAEMARLRELPGARGKTDEQLGEEFLEGQVRRFVAAFGGEVSPAAEIRVLIDPFSRQAFLAQENRICGILSF